MNLIIALLMMAGLFAVFGVNPFSPLKKLRDWRPRKRERRQTAKEFVRVLEGKKKENLVQRSLRDTKHSLTIIGQAEKYKRTVIFSVIVGIAAGAAGLLVFSSPLLMVVFGLGCALIPLWLTNLSVYAYAQTVNNELETALSMITTSYTRHNDIIKAITESLPQTNNPVKPVLERFVITVNNINSDIESAILQMKADLDNTLFHRWCDTLLLCQSDHTLKAGLQPIVAQISELKKQQTENETQMMIPLRDILVMVALVVGVPPLLMFMNPDWYYYLAHTIPGQIVMAVVAGIVFASIHKAIKLSKPIDYRI